MTQLEYIGTIEKQLWKAADTLRANSNYASNQYFLPVMGLLFLRHAYSRYLAVKDTIEANLPTRGGQARAMTKEDFAQQSAIFLRPEAQFDHLVALPDEKDRAKAIIESMESIERDHPDLRGILPKMEYQELDNEVLGQLLRALNPDALNQVSGDIFGRIYEYFLTRFADQNAHDGGEFFTPISLVSLIANVLDPDSGTVFDPACGSGGMFVQSARTVEAHGQNPTDRLTFRGLEKNDTTLRLARMNLAVHGLEGNIRQAITYYEDPLEMMGKADYVMANPPFNVDEIDAGRIKSDPRLPFGIPGANKQDRVSNGNYIWINYFYSYLNERGRAGFVMSSQASSAGGSEAKIRRKLVENGAVDVMIGIRSNFFYTRTVPCELWFLNRAKPPHLRDKVLMIDARGIYRKVTRRIYDFSPEQQQNLLAITWLYRGESARFSELVSRYLRDAIDVARACFKQENTDGNASEPLPEFREAIAALRLALSPFLETLPKTGAHTTPLAEFEKAERRFAKDAKRFRSRIDETGKQRKQTPDDNLNDLVAQLAPLVEASRDLIEQADLLCNKIAMRLIETCEKECDAKASDAWNARAIVRARKSADEARQNLTRQAEAEPVSGWGALVKVHYFWRQARWLTERFPEGKLCDVEGLVKLVTHAEIEANDWSLTPGRYVGVAPEQEDEGFDFRDTLRGIHEQLEELNAEATELAVTIKTNFEGLGV